MSKRGRTSRKRKKKTEKHSTLKDEAEVNKRNICFNQWLKEKFDFKPTKLVIAQCQNGGNGVFTKRNILPGNAIISIPEKMMIGAQKVIEESKVVKALLNVLDKSADDIDELTTVQVLSLFLIEEKRKVKLQQSQTSYGPYIEILPTSFSHPLYWNPNELDCLPQKEFFRISVLSKKVLTQMKQLNLLLTRINTSHKSLIFNAIEWEEYIWAWCCVNTRCVFSRHQSDIQLPGIRRTNEDNYYLIPYLDMLNHHPDADVEAKFNQKTKSFEIITFSPCVKYSELFIKYGEHGSTELLMEYGFVAEPELVNINDSIEFDLVDLSRSFQLKDLSSDCETLQVITEHKLHLDLTCIINTGPSWSLVVCCILLADLKLRISNQSSRNILMMIYSGKTLDHIFGIKSHVITLLIKRSLSNFLSASQSDIERKLSKIDEIQKSDSIHIRFLKRYLRILLFILDQSRTTVLDNSQCICSDFNISKS